MAAVRCVVDGLRATLLGVGAGLVLRVHSDFNSNSVNATVVFAAKINHLLVRRSRDGESSSGRQGKSGGRPIVGLA